MNDQQLVGGITQELHRLKYAKKCRELGILNLVV